MIEVMQSGASRAGIQENGEANTFGTVDRSNPFGSRGCGAFTSGQGLKFSRRRHVFHPLHCIVRLRR
jgi:hypothetical protein